MKNRTGFTLLEFILVIVILGIILGIALPKLGSFITGDELKASALRLLGALKDVRNRAILEQRYYRVYFELGTPKLSIELVQSVRDEESKKAQKKISGTVVVKGIWINGRGRIQEGEVYLTFSPAGYSEAFYVYLQDPFGREFTVGMNAFGTYTIISREFIEPQGI